MSDRILTRTQDLEDFCALCRDAPYITVDTEFLREKTYFPQLCLVQLGKPKTAGSEEMAVAVDPLSEDMNLSCLEGLFFNKDIVKVFHAARQDLEIMLQLFDGRLPAPLFDTQVAAMVTGYGDQIGYQSLVKQICNAEIDKSNQYTNWSRRPLSKDQIEYAIADVTHLRKIYETLYAQLQSSGRKDWVYEEMANLSDPSFIQTDPKAAWERVKIRSDKPKAMVVLKALAAWREIEAVAKDRPKHFILKDDVIGELAKQSPKREKDLEHIRGLPEKYRQGEHAKTLLGLIKGALEQPKETWPKKRQRNAFAQELIPALEMLKMLLKIQASEHGLVPRLLASNEDLEEFLMAAGDEQQNSLKIMQGWRKDIFGSYAKDMSEGKLVLCLQDNQIVLKRI